MDTIGAMERLHNEEMEQPREQDEMTLRQEQERLPREERARRERMLREQREHQTRMRQFIASLITAPAPAQYMASQQASLQQPTMSAEPQGSFHFIKHTHSRNGTSRDPSTGSFMATLHDDVRLSKVIDK